MMRFNLLLLTISLFVLPFASGQEEMPLVSEIKYQNMGAGTLDESQIKAYTKIKAGETLDRMVLQRDVKKLLATGLFSDVKVEMGPAVGDGVSIIYMVKNKLRLASPVIIKGVKARKTEKIREDLQLKVGDLVDEQSLKVSGLAVIDSFRSDYYPNVSLDWKLEAVDEEKGLAVAVLTINRGKKAKVKRVAFEGNEQLSDGDLKKAMNIKPYWDPRSLFSKKSYTILELEENRMQVQNAYLDAGYLDVNVQNIEIKPDDKEGAGANLKLDLKVNEGRQYTIGDITLSGVELFPEQYLLRGLPVKKGNVASIAMLDRARKLLREYYTSRGYMNSRVKYVLDPSASAEGVVDVRFVVVEGTLTKIRNIIIRGNQRTKDKVIRRELQVYPGDIYNQVKVDRSERIVNNLGFFSKVRVRPLSTPLPDQKDLVLEVEEQPTGNLMLGAGFSSIDKMMGFIEVSQANFDLGGYPPTGGGQKLKLRAQFGSRREIYEVSFIEPWFLDRKLSLGTDLYRTEVSSSDYAIDRTGGAISLGKKLPGPNRITFRYELEKVSSIIDTNTYYFLESDEAVDFVEDSKIQSALRVSILHNTCNHSFTPSRGTRATLFGELAGGILGFDTDIYKVGFKAMHYIPLWKGHVLSLKGQYEVVDTYDDTDEVPYSERLFVGGGRTIRGFDYRDVGPKVVLEPNYEGDDLSYRAYGGRTLMLGSVSYTIPIVQGLRLAFFYDIGNVWRDEYEFDVHNLASSAGTGLRLDVPGFPIRLDRAWVIEKDDEITEEDEWSIWIGHEF